ncbi:ATP-binding protein [Ottowia testudinis]|uniref:DNA binding domain-containing protein n=1 Tax=Ottowia testudinis TaxID=2816950 RepID=A0A975H5N2_9BURK|nr:ATP-binding protein [Ottowia testudinis]QTD45137.1 putative DNA binding domain-containing protein [Ottowia testudinis]
MISLDTLARWMDAPSEDEHLEFKEAKLQYDSVKLMRYCVALANEGGGHLVLGVSDRRPRAVVGTQAFANTGQITGRILEVLRIRVHVHELAHPDGRVLVFEVPSRPTAQPLHHEGAYLMRAGEELVPMTPDQLKRIFAEDGPDWFERPAKQAASADEVVALLDTQSFFELLRLPYPTHREAVLDRLCQERLVRQRAAGWDITNLAAVLLAKRLNAFSSELARKAPRFVIYEGANKLLTREDRLHDQGYAVGFEGLIEFIHSSAPLNRFVEQLVREEAKMFPKQAIRELVANALVHQNFEASGQSVMIEMYDDRLEVSNPGLPSIQVERFIDEFRSRNERLAELMRRMGLCEEKGSGVDKVVSLAEVFQLPAPDFRTGETRTTAVLFSHQEFAAMSKPDRVRACYQHCCLKYVSNQRMSNQSLRERFKLPETKMATASQVIGATKDAGLIKVDETETTSTRYARYLPFWA